MIRHYCFLGRTQNCCHFSGTIAQISIHESLNFSTIVK